jgi:hypothetical protein
MAVSYSYLLHVERRSWSLEMGGRRAIYEAYDESG